MLSLNAIFCLQAQGRVTMFCERWYGPPILHAYLFRVHIPAYMFPKCWPARLPACLPTCPPACPSVRPPAHLSTCLPACPRAHLSAYPPTRLPTYPPARTPSLQGRSGQEVHKRVGGAARADGRAVQAPLCEARGQGGRRRQRQRPRRARGGRVHV